MSAGRPWMACTARDREQRGAPGTGADQRSAPAPVRCAGPRQRIPGGADLGSPLPARLRREESPLRPLIGTNPRTEDYLKSYREQTEELHLLAAKLMHMIAPGAGETQSGFGWVRSMQMDAQPDAADESVPLLMSGPAAMAAEVDRAKTNTIGDTKTSGRCACTAPGFVSLLKMKRALAGRHSFPTKRGYRRNRRDDQRWSTYHLECPN